MSATNKLQSIISDLDATITERAQELDRLQGVRKMLNAFPKTSQFSITKPVGRPSHKTTKFLVETTKRSVGRPKGSRNKPKTDSPEISVVA